MCKLKDSSRIEIEQEDSGYYSAYHISKDNETIDAKIQTDLKEIYVWIDKIKQTQ